MTEQLARQLAKMDRNYSARCIRGQWLVWDAKSDHRVEFDLAKMWNQHPRTGIAAEIWGK
jgi:hypothetical protein